MYKGDQQEIEIQKDKMDEMTYMRISCYARIQRFHSPFL